MKKIVLSIACLVSTYSFAAVKNSPVIQWDGPSYEKGCQPQFDASKYVLEKLGIIFSGKKVLDMGCGTGRFVVEVLKSNACFVMGVDPSESMLKIAGQKLSESPLLDQYMLTQFDAENFNINRSEYNFDITMAWFCMHLVRDKRKAFKNMFYSLKPGGELACNISTTEDGDPLGVKVLEQFQAELPKSSEGNANKAAGRLTITQQELVEMLEQIGFVDIQTWHEPDLEQFFILKDRDQTKRFMLPLVMATPAYNQLPENIRDAFFEKYIDALEKELDKTGRVYTLKTTLVHARRPA